MFIRKLAFILFVIVVVAGCESGNDAGVSVDFEAAVKTTDKYGQYSTSFVQGDEIDITLSIKNVSSETKAIYFSSSKQYDFVINNENGVEVWRWSNNMGFAQALTSYELAPGQVRTFSYKWNQTISEDGTLIPVGNYTLEAVDIGIALKPIQALNIM